MLIVQKYGGSSVASAERIFNVAGMIAERYKENNDIVVVLSARGNTTDSLIEMANEINPNAPKRELDMLLSTGEQQSVAIMALALTALGLPAVSLTGWQAGIHSSSEHGGAKIMNIGTDRISAELKNRHIVLIAGFQGVDELGNITTLGRGASDTSAIALASALSADLCEIYTDVDGIYTADPRLLKDAIKHKEIGYDEMLELSVMGAKVLHGRSVELAKKFDVEFDVRSSLFDNEATRIIHGRGLEERTVSGVTADRNICKLSITGIKTGILTEILLLFAGHNIIIDTVVISKNNGQDDSLSFSFSESNYCLAIELLKEHKLELGLKEFFSEGNLTKLSVVGTGIAYDAGILATFHETLHREEIEIYLLSLSGIKISVLIDGNETEHAISKLHAAFAKAGVFA